ncbi:MAG: hypothetical protein KAI97_07000 [Gemmatimonadetes bacterium]|nr:hypothetical protein [Gemmatimonadota bacterium]
MTLGRAMLSLVAILLGLSCGSSSSPTAPPAGLEDHTVRRGGAFHRPGLTAPAENCVQCHGADLRGGDNGEPSCFSCHGNIWD